MKLVNVYNSISLTEVNYVRSLLESHDIEAVVFDEATAAIAPHYLFHQGGCRVMVREPDVAKATEIVNDYLSSKQKDPDDMM